jgi:Na+-driven multidrug efflux pump
MDAMTAEAKLLWSLGLTLLCSGVTVAYLQRPLGRLLDKVCDSPEETALGTRYIHLLLILLPIVWLLPGSGLIDSTAPATFQIASQVQWGLVGLVMSLLGVGILLLITVSLWRKKQSQHAIVVSSQQIDDLHRALLKLEEYRAREILKRPNAG